MKIEIPGEYHEGESGLSVHLSVYSNGYSISWLYESVGVDIDFDGDTAKLSLVCENGIKDYELSSADIDWKDDGFVIYVMGQPVLSVYETNKDDLIYQQMVRWLNEI